jgi:phage-related protein
VFAKIKTWFAEKFQSAYDAVTDIFRNIGSWFGERWTDIKKVFAKIKSWFSEKFSSAYDAVTDVFKGIGNWFKSRWDDITSAFSSVGDWFQEKFQKAYDSLTSIFSGVGEFFDGIWDGIKDGVKSIVNTVIECLNGMIGKVESGINLIVDGLNSLFTFSLPDWLGGKTFSLDIPHAELPRIPMLAQGTVVPANYGNFLAVLGDNKREPEIVAPESAIRKAVAAEISALKTGGDITVKLICDGRVLAQTVQKYDLKNRRASNGG